MNIADIIKYRQTILCNTDRTMLAVKLQLFFFPFLCREPIRLDKILCIVTGSDLHMPIVAEVIVVIKHFCKRVNVRLHNGTV